MWDKRYSADEYVYGTEPNTFFRENLLKQKAGKLLLPAEGEGRNAVFAAIQGWDVTAFDSSEVGKQKAEKLAEENGIKINYLLASYETIDLEENSFDMIALIYAHTDNREAIHKKLLKYLKPGGILLLEGFSKDQLRYNTGGPGNIQLLYSEEEIRTDFKTLTDTVCSIKEELIDAGPYHQGKASLLRFIGTKQQQIRCTCIARSVI